MSSAQGPAGFPKRRLLLKISSRVRNLPLDLIPNINSVALIENMHREDLHPIELGNIYRKLIEDGVFDSQEVLSRSISTFEPSDFTTLISEFISSYTPPIVILLRDLKLYYD